MRFDLFEGVRWHGSYSTRRAAMADADLFAAKRGQTVRWRPGSRAAVVGRRVPSSGDPAFTVREAAGVKWAHPRRGLG